jgi:hypothetical protein
MKGASSRAAGHRARREVHQTRGLRFGPGGQLYCVGRDHVVAFDFPTGRFLGVIAELRKLNGQAVLLLKYRRAVGG